MLRFVAPPLPTTNCRSPRACAGHVVQSPQSEKQWECSSIGKLTWERTIQRDTWDLFDSADSLVVFATANPAPYQKNNRLTDSDTSGTQVRQFDSRLFQFDSDRSLKALSLHDSARVKTQYYWTFSLFLSLSMTRHSDCLTVSNISKYGKSFGH